MGIQKGMESYLEKKYGEDFVVGVPRLEGGSGLGSEPDSHRAEAHPKSKDDLTFEVGKRYWNGSFFDNYTSRVWEHEERPRVEAFLKSLKPTLSYSNLQLTTGLSSAEAKDLIRGSVPSIDTAIKAYGNHFYYYLSARLQVQSLDERTKEDIRNQFIKVNEFIKSKGIKNSSFGIGIGVVDENATYSCSTNDISRLGSLEKMLDHCLSAPAKRGVN